MEGAVQGATALNRPERAFNLGKTQKKFCFFLVAGPLRGGGAKRVCH